MYTLFVYTVGVSLSLTDRCFTAKQNSNPTLTVEVMCEKVVVRTGALRKLNILKSWRHCLKSVSTTSRLVNNLTTC